jgi:hypothetical protein
VPQPEEQVLAVRFGQESVVLAERVDEEIA